VLTCVQEDSLCTFQAHFLNKSISILNSTLHFSNVDLYSKNQTITLDSSSVINANATGHAKGPGFDAENGSGGSFAGQGGNCYNLSFDFSYGSFDMTPSPSSDKTLEFGSGGGNEMTRGGGRVAVVANILRLNGPIYASGGPFD